VIKGVFFDLYGTLLIYRDMRAAWAAWRAELLRLLHAREPEFTRREMLECSRNLFSSAPPPACGRLTVYERKIRRMAREAGIALSHPAARRIASRTIAVWQKHIPPDPAAGKVIRELAKRGKKIALITNFDHPPHVHALLARMRIAPFFGAVIISGDAGFKKPDPRIFRIALARLNLRASETVFVGDSADDVRGARAAGITPVLVIRSRRAPFLVPLWARRARRVIVVRRLTELLELAGVPPGHCAVR